MSPQAAFLAGQKHAESDPLLKVARTFWIASLSTRKHIRDGEFALADQKLRKMTEVGEWLLGGAGRARGFGRHMLRTVSELSLQYIAGLADMAADMERGR